MGIVTGWEEYNWGGNVNLLIDLSIIFDDGDA
jgi:hypothetical protein